MVMTLVSVSLVDLVGRRPLLFGSTSLIASGMATLGAYFYLDVHDAATAQSITWLPLVSIIVLIAGFAIGLGPVPSLLSAEMLPQQIRGAPPSSSTLMARPIIFFAFVSGGNSSGVRRAVRRGVGHVVHADEDVRGHALGLGRGRRLLVLRRLRRRRRLR